MSLAKTAHVYIAASVVMYDDDGNAETTDEFYACSRHSMYDILDFAHEYAEGSYVYPDRQVTVSLHRVSGEQTCRVCQTLASQPQKRSRPEPVATPSKYLRDIF